MSLERERLLKALGAEIDADAGGRGNAGARSARPRNSSKARRIRICPSSSSNPANAEIHRQPPRPRKSWRDLDREDRHPGKRRGHRRNAHEGSGEVLKKRQPAVQIIAVEPVNSPVIGQLSEKRPPGPALHKIQGIGAGFIPGVLNVSIIDDVIAVRERRRVRDIPPAGSRGGCSVASPVVQPPSPLLESLQKKDAGKAHCCFGPP